jgi:2-phospho-L-lactate guanylyltransferase
MRRVNLEPSSDARIVVIVPVGRLEGAKSRLGAMLDAEERRDLAERLARRTIEAAVATPGVAETLVVTPDDEVRRMATDAGARPIRQRGDGLNEALRTARSEALAGGATAVIVVPIDLPALSAPALETVVRAVAEPGGPRVVLVPDRHDRGTNVLAISPPDAIDLQFGGESRAAHAAAAREAGADLVVLNGPLRIDLDTPDDLLIAEQLTPDAVRAG